MLVQVGLLGESGFAAQRCRIGAGERSLPRVDAQVVQEVVQFGEGSLAATIVALE